MLHDQLHDLVGKNQITKPTVYSNKPWLCSPQTWDESTFLGQHNIVTIQSIPNSTGEAYDATPVNDLLKVDYIHVAYHMSCCFLTCLEVNINGCNF